MRTTLSLTCFQQVSLLERDIMKHIKSFALIGAMLGGLLLSSCSFITPIGPTSTDTSTTDSSNTSTTDSGGNDTSTDTSIPDTGETAEWEHDETKHWRYDANHNKIDEYNHSAGDWIIDTAPTTTTAGSKHKECTACHYRMEEATIPMLTSEVKNFKVYAINDFHGATHQMKYIAGYLNANDDGNTIIISSGDTYQGSITSNTNYGALLGKSMRLSGFDAFTLGNHDFDWGLTNLQRTKSVCADVRGEYEGTPFKYLGANIFHWDAASKTFGDYASELAEPYVIKTLENGLKVGIIGCIGSNQITSISSQYVQTIGFKDPAPIVKEYATKLKSEEGCDAVIVSIHSDADGLIGTSNCSYSGNYVNGITGTADFKNYVDAVFTAHSHQEYIYDCNGLTFIQGGGNGQYVSQINFAVGATGTVSALSSANNQVNASWPINSKVQKLIDDANNALTSVANENLGSTSDDLAYNVGVPRLVSYAIASYCESQNISIDIAMCNSGRSTLGAGSITYSELFSAIPFDNVVYVAKVSGKDIIYEAKYNAIYRVNPSAFVSSQMYTVATLDYLLYHQNKYRSYDYFPTAFASGSEEPVALTKTGESIYNYRLITRDYLRGLSSINCDLYNVTNNHTNTGSLSSAVTF